MLRIVWKSMLLSLGICVGIGSGPSVFAQGASAPVLANLTDAKAQLWNAPFTVIDTNATVTDSDSANFGGGLLIVKVKNGVATDRLSIKSATVFTNPSRINVSGQNVRFGNTVIGTLVNAIPVSGATELRVQLNNNATPSNTTSLLRAITYRNQSSASLTGTRTIQFKLTDGDGGSSPFVNKNIRVGTFDGDYTGTYQGTVSIPIPPFTVSIPGPFLQNTSIETTILNSTATVVLPGLANSTGTGTVSNNGTFSATSGGTISGFAVQVAFTGLIRLNANGTATGSGTWAIVNTPGFSGSGTWSQSRP